MLDGKVEVVRVPQSLGERSPTNFTVVLFKVHRGAGLPERASDWTRCECGLSDAHLEVWIRSLEGRGFFCRGNLAQNEMRRFIRLCVAAFPANLNF